MRSSAARGSALLSLGLLLACQLPRPEAAGPCRGEDSRVLVYYPRGDCGGVLEIEVYDRIAGRWAPHPEHPWLPPGACAREEAGTLLNELRVRCADPENSRRPSEWVVGAEVASTSPACENAPRAR